MKRLLCLLLLLSSAGFAQELRIKGHAIGESLQTFLASEPKLQKDHDRCKGGKHRGSLECMWVHALERDNWSVVGSQSANWAVAGDELVSVSMFPCGTYTDLVDDLRKRLRSNPNEYSEQMQNGFGASWTERRSVWDTPKYHVTVSEQLSPVMSKCGPWLRITTQEFHRFQLANERKPSPFD